MAGPPTAAPRPLLPVVESQLRESQVWKDALAAYQTNPKLPKELVLLATSTSPQDLLMYLKSTQEQKSKSKENKVMLGIKTCMDILQRHEKAIDMFAQAGGMPGCLAWGSMRLALELVRGYINDYERLLKALTDIVDWLRAVMVEAQTFVNSSLIERSLLALFVSIIQFWEKAILAYTSRKANRLMVAFRSLWSDYDEDYRALKYDMERHLSNFRAAAVAAHHLSFENFSRSQKDMNSDTVKRTQTTRHREIVRWLSPLDDAPYGPDFHKLDLEAALEVLCSGTCQWILEDLRYRLWLSDEADAKSRLLWIFAKPGTGKTVLSAFLIDHSFALNRAVFYFFFNRADSNKNSPGCAVRSLLYQIYAYSRRAPDFNYESFEEELDNDGGGRAKNFERLWSLFLKCLKRCKDPIIVLDALDECVDDSKIIGKLQLLSEQRVARVIATCRSCSQNPLDCTPLEVGTEQVCSDIESFISNNTVDGVLSLPHIRPKVMSALRERSGGMFLWAKLTLDELSTKFTEEEIMMTLEGLPDGLDELYYDILVGLVRATKKSQHMFCQKVLRWLVCGFRPLTIDELFDALRADYGGHFLYSRESIVTALGAACGALVTIRTDTVQLVHFSAKEFLLRGGGGWELNGEICDFFISPATANKILLSHIIAYLSSDALQAELLPYGSAPVSTGDGLQGSFALLDYSAENWVRHLGMVDRLDRDEVEQLRAFLNSPNALAWLQIYLTINRDQLYQLFWHCQSLADRPIEGDDQIDFIQPWGRMVCQLLSQYGKVLQDTPELVFKLDAGDSWNGPGREQLVKAGISMPPHFHKLPGYFKTTSEVPALRRLHIDPRIDDPRLKQNIVGFCHLSQRHKAFIYLDNYPYALPQLYMQSRLTAQHCEPVVCPPFDTETRSGQLILTNSLITDDEMFVAALYVHSSQGTFFLWVWKLTPQPFDKKVAATPWATIVFSTNASETLPQIPSRYVVSPVNLAWGNGNILFCFGALINLTTGHIERDTYDRIESHGKGARLSYYGRGESLCLLMPDRGALPPTATRFSPGGQVIGEINIPRGPVVSMENISASGRYVLWNTTARKRFGLIFHDTSTGFHQDLTGDLLAYSWWKMTEFDKRERFLVVKSEIGMMGCISVWKISNGSIDLVAKREYEHLEVLIHGWFIDSCDDELYLITLGRTWSRYTLPKLLPLDKDYNQEEENSFKTFGCMSRDGETYAAVGYNGLRTFVRKWRIFDSFEMTADFEVCAWGTATTFIFSGDLNWVLIGTALYSVARGSPLGIPLQIDGYVVEFSSCHNYLAAVNGSGNFKKFDLRAEFGSDNYFSPGTISLGGLKDSERGILRTIAHPWASMVVVVVWKQDLVVLTVDCWAIPFGNFEMARIGERHSIELEASHGVGLDIENDREGSHAGVFHHVQKFACLSRCGGYLRLSAFWESHVWNRVVDIPQSPLNELPAGEPNTLAPDNTAQMPPLGELSLQTLPTMPKEPERGPGSNPRVISTDWVYWFDHRFRLSIYDQRLLLSRSPRCAENRDQFERFGIHTPLTIIPVSLVASKPSLLIPENNTEPMRAFFEVENGPVEIVSLELSWDGAILELDQTDVSLAQRRRSAK